MSNDSHIDYGRPQQGNGTQVPMWLAVLLILSSTVVLFFAIGPTGPTSRRTRERANQVLGSSNLRQIGQAIQLYAIDHQGAFPPDFQTILVTQPISSEVFVCPSTDDVKAPPQSSLSQPGHCSYIYTGTALTTKSDPECIVALEDPANHQLEGADVLFADGHVDWMLMSTVMHYFNELNAGHNPPRPEPSPGISEKAARQDYEKNWKPRMPQLKTFPWSLPTTQQVIHPE